MIPETTYHIITRLKQPEKAIMYQKLPDMCPPFGLDRTPSCQFTSRLRNFDPSLTDAIIVASSSSTDIGLVTRTTNPLTRDVAVEKVINVFTTTSMADDSRRAQLPMTENFKDSSPIGLAFDLSSTERVKRPLPKEEYEESPGPLPAVMVLNNEGVLATWWLVYTESIRQGTTYSGLVAVSKTNPQQLQPQGQATPFGQAASSGAPTFGASAFGKPSTPSNSFAAQASPKSNLLGSAQQTSGGFGATSGLGQKSSPWGGPSTTLGSQTSAPAFGQTGFGPGTPSSTTVQGSGFGMTGGLGNRASPWGAPSGPGAPTGSNLGSQASPFGVITGGNSSASTAGGFASFAKSSSGFGTAQPSGDAPSLFGKQPSASAFDAGGGIRSGFGNPEQKSTFGEGTFSLGSTFKADDKTGGEAEPAGDSTKSLFGSGFGNMLGNTAPAQSKDADMDESEDAPVVLNTSQKDQSEEHKSASAPAPVPAAPKFNFPKTEPPKIGGLFGTQSQSKITPAAVQDSKPAGFMASRDAQASNSREETPQPPDRTRPTIDTSPKIKEEPQSDEDDISPLNEEEAQPPEGFGDLSGDGESSENKRPETPARSRSGSAESPLPPESTSKTTYAPGDSSNSSKSSDDVPLPPDFIPSKSKLHNVEPATKALPTDDEEDGEEGQVHDSEEEETDEPLDDEGSGIDVAQEFSPSSSKESSKLTEAGSFGFAHEKSSTENTENLFSTAMRQPLPESVPLFGEVGRHAQPLFPPSTKAQEGPRSPSPIRPSNIADSLRPDNARSVSAPGPMRRPNSRFRSSAQPATPKAPHQSTNEARQKEQERIKMAQAKKYQAEHQDLDDDEAEANEYLLQTEPTPSRNLDDFLTHQDYVGNIDKPGLAGQIEKVFRDINSMIHTLGFNARALKSFTMGHEQTSKQSHCTRDDLDSLDDWCIVDVEGLNELEGEFEAQLEESRLQNVPEKISNIRGLQGDISDLRCQSKHVARTIKQRRDSLPNVEAASEAPLNLDQQTQLRDIRRAFTHLQKQVSDAEQGLVLIRTKVASQANGTRANGKQPLRQPTVEAVENTIRKMTNMINKRHDEIDVLSSQMEGLHLPPPTIPEGLNDENLNSSRHGTSRLSTPASARKSHLSPLQHSRYRSRTSNQQYGDSSRQHFLEPDGEASTGANAAGNDELQAYRAKARKRREINEVVKDVFGKDRVKVRELD
ncbi:uncharacterized protein KY384_002629 [Bacidia gigantensis]|uniref:uncharacterized protein n=1 Tax=Bacidia gigantensis TaxID=2732470 RepID=UPI001D040571|nr:uncharacterized protein KY384_002629 [Bacidia gigantensis]KAG8532751.1 hypothetical protein KY384_002629 [Bacidia gigantensis]